MAFLARTATTWNASTRKGASSAPNTTVDLFRCNETVAQAWHITLTGQ
jgi:hypothetical protein